MIVCQTPLRVSFFGGGTDLPYYFRESEKGGQVLSAAIDKSTYVIANKLYRDKIVINWSKKEEADSYDKIKHEYVREVLKYFKIDFGIEITTLADIPSEGSGLASSSSILVGLINTISTLIGSPMNQREIAELAVMIEIDMLGKPIGLQDQYAVSCGGINHIKFDGVSQYDCYDENGFGHELSDTIKVNKLNYDPYFFNKFVIVNTGSHRMSSKILSKQILSIHEKQEQYDKIFTYCSCGIEYYKNGMYKEFGELLNSSMEQKRQLSDGIVTRYMDSLRQKADNVVGWKICGAGGGGYILLMTDDPQKTQQSLEDYDSYNINIDNQGTRIVFNNEH